MQRPMTEPLESRRLLSAVVSVDNNVTHQTINGWGDNGFYGHDTLSNAQRSQVVSMVYGQLKLNLGMVGTLQESTGSYTQQANDDNDPNHINWAGFQPFQEGSYTDNWINFPSTIIGPGGTALTAKQLGLSDYFLGGAAPNVRWQSTWLNGIRTGNPGLYVAEVAEQILADVLYYKNTYNDVPKLYFLGNEELSGNHAIYANGNTDTYPGGSTKEMVDIVKAAGAKLTANGFSSVKFLVGTEETEYSSYDLARAILVDPTARQYVGALGYHEYPYGSEYSSLARVLSTSGTGNPPADAISIRNQLRDLGKQYGVPVWLTEVSHGNVGGSPPVQGNMFDALRARAIDIHDNLVYADAAGYMIEGAEWNTVEEQEHFGSAATLDQIDAEDGDSFAVVGDPVHNQFRLTMGAHALGHYSRWVRPGDVRVDATSSDPLVQLTAFRDGTANADAFVLINNNVQPESVTIRLSGGAFLGPVTGEQSTPSALWTPLGGIAATDAKSIILMLPAQSVTSLSASLALVGDANRSGAVDFADLVVLAQNYGLRTGATWSQGDFNDDASVGFDDLVALARNYGRRSAANPLAPAWASGLVGVRERPHAHKTAAPLIHFGAVTPYLAGSSATAFAYLAGSFSNGLTQSLQHR